MGRKVGGSQDALLDEVSPLYVWDRRKAWIAECTKRAIAKKAAGDASLATPKTSPAALNSTGSSSSHRPASSDADLATQALSPKRRLQARKSKAKTAMWDNPVAKAARKVPTPGQADYDAADRYSSTYLIHAASANNRWKDWCVRTGHNRKEPPSMDTFCTHMKSCLHVHYRDVQKQVKGIGITKKSLATHVSQCKDAVRVVPQPRMMVASKGRAHFSFFCVFVCGVRKRAVYIRHLPGVARLDCLAAAASCPAPPGSRPGLAVATSS
jgi:hypothetical protein